eukprot:m.78833 g.78833  ORF g.78833 m.78833 type:complete len:406 (+) comp10751_c0_seq1:837-2054(+)
MADKEEREGNEAAAAVEPAAAAAGAEAGPQEDFSDMESYGIITIGGTDKIGSPVFCFKAALMPTDPRCDFDKLLRYMKKVMEQIVEADYSIVYLHHGLNSKNKPQLSWLKKVYGGFERKYKKNLKALYIVHATMFVKTVITFIKPFISKKFGKKIHFCQELADLNERVFVDKLGVPPLVAQYDAEVTAKKAEKAAKKGKNSEGGGKLCDPATLVFGAELADMKAVNDAGIPHLVDDIIEYITTEEGGITSEGIFRRSVALGKVRELKERYNGGERVDLKEVNDAQMAAVLLKSFFRELATPLLTFELYEDFLNLTQIAEAEAKLAAYKEVIGRLPERNVAVLRRLTLFLREVTKHEPVNKMSINNLSIVFGPNLLWSNDAASSFSDAGKINVITRFILEEPSVLE